MRSLRVQNLHADTKVKPLHPYSEEIRKEFPQLQASSLVYLDNAATSLKPYDVINRIQSHLSFAVSNVHRSVHTMAHEASELLECARIEVAQAINASPREIFFTYNASYGLSLLAEAFRQHSNSAYVSYWNHHSNLLPWAKNFQVFELPADQAGRIELDSPILRGLSPGDIVAVSHVSNVTGLIQPIQELAKLCRQRRANLIVDGTQAFPHLNIDVRYLDADCYVFSAHKAFGPTGVGIVYVRDQLLKMLQPPLIGGGSVSHVLANGQFTLRDYPHSFELGTPNVEGIIGTGAAIAFRRRLLLDELSVGAQIIRSSWLAAADSLQHFTPIGGYCNDNHISLLTFGCRGIDSDTVAVLLSDRFGIQVRSGFHCAQPIYMRNGITGGIRFSAYAYNTFDECAKAIEALKILDAPNVALHRS